MGGAAGGGTVIAMSVIAADVWDRSDWPGSAESAAPGQPGSLEGIDTCLGGIRDGQRQQ
jgi:hypothetical protein